MESITSYNGIDFTDFLEEMNLYYKDAADAYVACDVEKERDCLNVAYGMKSAFLLMFGGKLNIVRTDKITEHIIIER
jgi:hypothetical protein